MDLKVLWFLLVFIFLANNVYGSREKRCAVGPVSSAQRLPSQVSGVLAAIAPTESTIMTQVHQTGTYVLQNLQPVYDQFNVASNANIDNMTVTSRIFDQCAINQAGVTVPSSVYDPVQKCIEANVNMANYVLKTMRETATTEISNFVTNYNRKRTECLILSLTTAKIKCLQQVAAQLEFDSRVITANLLEYITIGKRMIASYESSTAMCYANNIMKVASSLQNLGVNPSTCGVRLPATLSPNLDIALRRYNTVSNLLNTAMQTNFDIASIQLTTLDHSFNYTLQAQLDRLKSLVQNIILCGNSQGINISTSIGNPVLNCLRINENNITIESAAWKSYINSTVTTVRQSLITTKANCLNLPVTDDKITCLINAANSFERNSSQYIQSINATILAANNTINTLINNVNSCPITNNQTIISAAENLGVDFTKCNGSYIDYLAIALQNFNSITNQANALLSGSVASSLNAFRITIGDYTLTLNNVTSSFQQFIEQIKQCGRVQGITNISTSIFAPIVNCISLSNDVLQSLIPAWNSTLINTMPTALRNLQAAKEYCLSLSTIGAKIQCLNTTALAYQNSVPLVIRDLYSLLITANTTSSNFGDVLKTCNANQLEFVFTDISNAGINLANCNNISTIQPIIFTNNVTVALQNYDASISQANGLLQSKSLASMQELQMLVNNYQLTFGNIQEAVRIFSANITQCAVNQGISTLPSTIFSPFTNCISDNANNVQSQIVIWNATLADTVTAANRHTDSQKRICLALASSSAIIQCLNNAVIAHNISMQNIIRDYKSLVLSSSTMLDIFKEIIALCYVNNYGQVLTSISNLGVNVTQCSAIPMNSLPIPVNIVGVAIQNFQMSVANSHSLLQHGSRWSLTSVNNFIDKYKSILTRTTENLEHLERTIAQCAGFQNLVNVSRDILNPISSCVISTNNIVQNLIPVWRSGFVNTTHLTLESIEEQKRICLQLSSPDDIVACLNRTSNLYRESIPKILGVYNSTLLKVGGELESFERALERCYTRGYRAVFELGRRHGIDLSHCRPYKMINNNELELALENFNIATNQAFKSIQNGFSRVVGAFRIILANHMNLLSQVEHNFRRLRNNVIYCARSQGFYQIPSYVFEPMSNCIYSTDENLRHRISTWNATLNNKVISDRHKLWDQKNLCLSYGSRPATIMCLSEVARMYVYNERIVTDYFQDALEKVLAEVHHLESILKSCYPKEYYTVVGRLRNGGVNVNMCMLN